MSKHLNEAVEGDDGGLVICRGCKARGTYAEPPSGKCPIPYKSDAVLLAESLAREQALQQLLNAADQRIDELTRPHGEQVAHMPVERCYDVRAKMIIAFNEAKKSGGDLDDALDAAYKSALRFSPNPLATEQPDRSPENYAIEHAEYMAKSADDVLAKFQAYGLALLAVDEGGDDGEGELFEAVDSTRQDLQESLVDLRGMVYEFRKRSNRCTPL